MQRDRDLIKPMQVDPPALSQAAEDAIEKEAKLWWQGTIDKVDRRFSDSSQASSKAFSERLSAALSQKDAEVTPQLAETLRPLQQRVEEYIQAEVRESASKAGAQQLRTALREGSDAALLQLEATVNSSMLKAKSSW